MKSIFLCGLTISHNGSDKGTPKSPSISCGFYRLEKGTPLEYEYTYDEMKIGNRGG